MYVADSTIIQNRASSVFDATNGGGFYIENGKVVITNTKILSNTANGGPSERGRAGAIYLKDKNTKLYVFNSIIRGNSSNGNGGMMASQSASTAWFTNTEISSNSVTYLGSSPARGNGGAFYSKDSGMQVTLVDSEIRDNEASNKGGGIYLFNNKIVYTLTNTSLSNNTGINGGGAYVEEGQLRLIDSEVSYNQAITSGGGIYNEDSGRVDMTNITVSSNTASSNGGGIYNIGPDSMITMTHTTSNTASSGGGIYRSSGTVSVRNSIVANSVSGGNCAGTVGSNGYNLSSDGSCTNFISSGDQQNIDPLLGLLAANGGPTAGVDGTQSMLIHALLSDSPALEGAVCVSGLTTDQRGVSRPDPSPFCDIGAYESNLTAERDLSIIKTVTPSVTFPGDTITFTLTFFNAGIGLAAGVVITDIIPVSVTVSSIISSGDVAITETTVTIPTYTFAVADLTHNKGGIITITGTLSDPLGVGIFTNTAEITTTSVDSDTTNNSDSVQMGIPEAEISGTYYFVLQDAIDAAVNGDTIKVIGGTLPDTPLTRAGLNQIGYVTKSITIEGGYDSSFTTVDPNSPTVLDAGGAGRGLVVSGTVKVELINLLLTSGDATAGGGIFIDLNGTARLTGTTVSYNQATNRHGGGIFTRSPLVLTNTIVSSNTAIQRGGGIYNRDSSVTINGTSEVGYNTANQQGGGIYNRDEGSGATLTLNDSAQVSSNTATEDGGGIFNYDGGSGATLTLNDSAQVSSNTATEDGGGIFNYDGGGGATLTLNDSAQVSNNTAGDDGGGIYSDGTSGSNPTITLNDSSEVSGNRAVDNGAGIDNREGMVILTATSRVYNNIADSDGNGVGNGGGISNDDDGGSGVSITLNGNSQVISNTAEFGGGIYIYDDGGGATLVLNDNSQVISNTAGDDGGGVHSDGAGGGNPTVTLNDSSEVSGNRAVDNGAGIDNREGTVILTATSRVYNNIADSDGNGVGNGGGINNDDDGGATLVLNDNSQVISNTSTDDGGGIYNESGTVTMNNSSQIVSNQAARHGGGIDNYDNGQVTLNGASMYNNTAVINGGGINNHFESRLTLNSASVYSNTAGNIGGGINSGAIVTIISSTISYNQAIIDGGGISGLLTSTTTLVNATISNNDADVGGGINTAGLLTATNTTIVDNTATTIGGGLRVDGREAILKNTLLANNSNDCTVDNGGVLTSGGYNLDSDGSCGLTSSGDLSNVSANLGPLQNNGGNTETHDLLAGSYAINGGDNTTCTSAPVNSIDQRGEIRPSGSSCDIGALETQNIPLIMLTKAIANAEPGPGDTITYTIVLSNSGLLTATNVVVTDTLPGVTFQSVTMTPLQSGATLASGPGDLPILASGLVVSPSTSVTLTVTAVVDILADDTVVVNTVSVTINTEIPSEPALTASASFTVMSADLALIKDAPANASPGDTITCTITVYNQSFENTATSIVISDTLPGGVTFTNAGSSLACGSSDNSLVTCTIASLGPVMSTTLYLAGTITDTAVAGTSLENRATISSSYPYDALIANNSDTADTSIVGLADLGLTKTGDITATAGEQIEYTITVVNNGPSVAQAVIVEDLLPAEVTFNEATIVRDSGNVASCDSDCTVGDMMAAETITITLSGTVEPSVAEGQVLTNSVTVSAYTTDPLSTNDSDVHTTTIETEANLSITKIDLEDPVRPTEGFVYEIIITNDGPSEAQNVMVTDTLGSNLTFASVSAGCTGNSSSKVVTCTVGTLAAQGSMHYLLAVIADDVPTGTILTNTVTVASDTFDPDISNNTFCTLSGICYLGTITPGTTALITTVLSVDSDFDGTSLINLASVSAD